MSHSSLVLPFLRTHTAPTSPNQTVRKCLKRRKGRPFQKGGVDFKSKGKDGKETTGQLKKKIVSGRGKRTKVKKKRERKRTGSQQAHACRELFLDGCSLPITLQNHTITAHKRTRCFTQHRFVVWSDTRYIAKFSAVSRLRFGSKNKPSLRKVEGSFARTRCCSLKLKRKEKSCPAAPLHSSHRLFTARNNCCTVQRENEKGPDWPVELEHKTNQKKKNGEGSRGK
ncbi:unnamed protein product [Trypanosoma congolense IL3000]|uniref:WGS project CAEQ00000000 data, annotated contig 1751 n=1 Tax=Trypanosoma congolense (strain IL3000) TaxID=1068625 RepID=F9W8N0_TRYCI|nr:unnamed protein product [Trypanosoma congolense IL3000]